jgi:hypothetical protein
MHSIPSVGFPCVSDMAPTRQAPGFRLAGAVRQTRRCRVWDQDSFSSFAWHVTQNPGTHEMPPKGGGGGGDKSKQFFDGIRTQKQDGDAPTPKPEIEIFRPHVAPSWAQISPASGQSPVERV